MKTSRWAISLTVVDEFEEPSLLYSTRRGVEIERKANLLCPNYECRLL